MSVRLICHGTVIALVALMGFIVATTALAQGPEPLFRAGGNNVGKFEDGSVACYVTNAGDISCVRVR